MKQLILIVICVLGMSFTTQSQTKENTKLLTIQDYKQKIINIVGVKNIMYDVFTLNTESNPTYPATPLCQNYNPNGESWIIYEWNGQYYYGIYGAMPYTEVPVTTEFATQYCKRHNSLTITLPE